MVLAAFARVLQKSTVPADSNVDANELGACLRDVSALLRVAARIPCELYMGTVNGFAPRDEKARAKQRHQTEESKTEQRLRTNVLEVLDLTRAQKPLVGHLIDLAAKLGVKELRELAKILRVVIKRNGKLLKRVPLFTSVKKKLQVG